MAGANGDAAGMSGAPDSPNSDDPAFEHDRYGSLSEAGGEILAPGSDGNIIQMNRTMILKQFTVSLHISSDQQALFFVFSANNWNMGPLVPIWTAAKAIKAGLSREELSPPLSLQLEADKLYWVGVSLPIGPGSIEHGFHGANYFASSALVDTVGVGVIDSPPPISISVYMPYKPSTSDPVLETLTLSLPN